MVEIEFKAGVDGPNSAGSWVFVGTKAALCGKVVAEALPAGVNGAMWNLLVEQTKVGSSGVKIVVPCMDEGKLRRVFGIVIPTRTAVSRHNHPYSPHGVTTLLSGTAFPSEELQIVLVLEDASDAFAAGCSVSRAFPIYNRKTGAERTPKRVNVSLVLNSGEESLESIVAVLNVIVDSIRATQRLVDSPPNELTVDAYVKECLDVAEEVGAESQVFRTEELKSRGMGCIEGVGRAATEYSGEPAMVILSKRKGASDDEKQRSVAFVGKGIIFDTGGLALKSREGMCEMKMDMGGSAACLQAFRAAAKLNFDGDIHVVMCIAENGIGPTALKPDDVITSYSGKTIEINNPDAEGRLVLADGVAYAAKDLGAKQILDMATLTGAQMIATGQRHGAVITNDESTERDLCAAGKLSGDLTWALPYCPEFYRAEFASRVADMKNSVKNRANAQTSCAAQFVADHLPADYAGAWAHIDMAGCAMKDGRATGYGVALLVQYLGLAV